MNLGRTQLYRIIVEEYLKEEGIELSEDKADDLLKWLRGGEKPDWVDDEREAPPPPEVPAIDEPEEKDDSSTYPMEMPPGADMSDEDIVDSISRMIQGKDPEHVSELFQAVFAKIPGVELGPPEDEEPESLYSPDLKKGRGPEGRTVVPGLHRDMLPEELAKIIREVLKESAPFHDMFDDYVPFETELAQKVVDAGGRADEATMSVKPEELENQLWEWLSEAAHDVGRIGANELKEMHYDVIERILDIQASNEDV